MYAFMQSKMYESWWFCSFIASLSFPWKSNLLIVDRSPDIFILQILECTSTTCNLPFLVLNILYMTKVIWYSRVHTTWYCLIWCIAGMCTIAKCHIRALNGGNFEKQVKRLLNSTHYTDFRFRMSSRNSERVVILHYSIHKINCIYVFDACENNYSPTVPHRRPFWNLHSTSLKAEKYITWKNWWPQLPSHCGSPYLCLLSCW